MEIGRYTTIGVKLGQGAFGTVELATDGKKQIAIKCIEKNQSHCTRKYGYTGK